MISIVPFLVTHGYCQDGEKPDCRGQTQPALGEMRRVARGGAFALVGVAVSAVLQFALVLVVTHGLPRATAGAFLEAVALFMILSNWTELGADTGVVRMVPRLRASGRDGDLRTLVRAAVVPVALAGAAAAALVLVLAGPASQVFFGSEAQSGETFLLVLAPALPFACVLTVLLAVTRGFGRMRPFVLITNVWVPGARLRRRGSGDRLIGADPGRWRWPGRCRSWLGLRSPPPPSAASCDGGPSRWPRRASPVSCGGSRFPRALAVGCAVTVNWVDVLLVGAIVGPPQRGRLRGDQPPVGDRRLRSADDRDGGCASHERVLVAAGDDAEPGDTSTRRRPGGR